MGNIWFIPTNNLTKVSLCSPPCREFSLFFTELTFSTTEEDCNVNDENWPLSALWMDVLGGHIK